jgi:hypothetical protein
VLLGHRLVLAGMPQILLVAGGAVIAVQIAPLDAVAVVHLFHFAGLALADRWLGFRTAAACLAPAGPFIGRRLFCSMRRCTSVFLPRVLLPRIGVKGTKREVT